MTLVKYYKNNTCYDGQREFTNVTDNSSRHYPDEYLIAHILERYHRKRFPDSSNTIVLTEPWLTDTHQPTRNGGKNTLQINELIIQQIKLAEKDIRNTLILVPFLYGYHHPGITIDIKNKTAIYLDPFGADAHYAEVIALQDLLKQKGFKLLTVKTRQQTDAVSCGPILTASMIKFIEEFMATGTISVDAFKSPRPNLATERLFQMYVNNARYDEGEGFVDEIMLADEELLSKVFNEQGLSEAIAQKILETVKKQKNFIGSLPKNWEENPSQKLAVVFIKNFQAQITEYIFLKESDFASKIDGIVDVSNQLFDREDLILDNDRITELFNIQDLLSEDHIAQTHSILGLMAYPKNQDQQIYNNLQNFEEDKNEIQEQFKTSLQALKAQLDSLAKNDVTLKEGGQSLFTTLFSKQEEFFLALKTNLIEEEVIAKIADFRIICAENIIIADKIMGYGWLYRTAEILIKAIVGLFAGIGMILGSVLGQGIVNSEHREKFANTFFTLNQKEQSQALNEFTQEILGDSEENQGLLSSQSFK